MLTRAGNVAVDNAVGCERQKTEIRRWVLDVVRPARVLDVFAGLAGELHRKVWCAADDYLGIDERWSPNDGRRRLFGDAYELLRAIDLQPWNIFDIDCYGEPWRALLTIGDRRRWAHGERGAIVCTNSTLRQKMNYASHAQVQASGLIDRRLGRTTVGQRDAMRDLAFARWASSSGLEIEQMRMARFTARSGMEYLGLVVRGVTPPAAAADLAVAGPVAPPPPDRASPPRREPGTRPRYARP